MLLPYLFTSQAVCMMQIDESARNMEKRNAPETR
jgi:hypothetical protein